MDLKLTILKTSLTGPLLQSSITDTDFLAVEIETSLGPIVIATTYLPPRRSFLLYTDMLRLLSNNIPTYILGDFTSRHVSFGNRENNTVGKSLINLINQGRMVHIFQHFLAIIFNKPIQNFLK